MTDEQRDHAEAQDQVLRQARNAYFSGGMDARTKLGKAVRNMLDAERAMERAADARRQRREGMARDDH